MDQEEKITLRREWVTILHDRAESDSTDTDRYTIIFYPEKDPDNPINQWTSAQLPFWLEVEYLTNVKDTYHITDMEWKTSESEDVPRIVFYGTSAYTLDSSVQNVTVLDPCSVYRIIHHGSMLAIAINMDDEIISDPALKDHYTRRYNQVSYNGKIYYRIPDSKMLQLLNLYETDGSGVKRVTIGAVIFASSVRPYSDHDLEEIQNITKNALK